MGDGDGDAVDASFEAVGFDEDGDACVAIHSHGPSADEVPVFNLGVDRAEVGVPAVDEGHVGGGAIEDRQQ